MEKERHYKKNYFINIQAHNCLHITIKKLWKSRETLIFFSFPLVRLPNKLKYPRAHGDYRVAGRPDWHWSSVYESNCLGSNYREVAELRKYSVFLLVKLIFKGGWVDTQWLFTKKWPDINIHVSCARMEIFKTEVSSRIRKPLFKPGTRCVNYGINIFKWNHVHYAFVVSGNETRSRVQFAKNS